jgi:hypothetical protein
MKGLECHWNHFALSSSKIIYGSIYVLVLLEIISDHPPAEWVTVLILLLTMLGIMLAEAYSGIVGEEVRICAPLTSSQRWHVVRESLPITYGVAVPAILLALSEAGLIEMDRAYTMAQWGLLAVLFVFGFLSRRLSGGSLTRSIMVGLLAVAIGLMIIKIRIAAETAKTYIY